MGSGSGPLDRAEGTVSEVSLSLDGVIVARDPTASLALVRRSDAARALPLRIGQELAGYVLVEVSRDSARLRGPNGAVTIFLSGESLREPPLGLVSREEEEQEKRRRLERERWMRRAFSRERARRRLEKEIPVILAETRLDPWVEDGEVLGLKLGRLPDGTLLSESGLLPGDLLLSLNERPLLDLDALWETLAHLDGEDELRLVLERRGEVVRLAYELTR